jgi:hypothetical protein
LGRNRESLGEGFYLGVNEDQWQHHFEKANFLPFHQLTAEQHAVYFSQHEFLKLALKYDLDKWNEMPLLLKEGYQKIAGILA